MRLVPLVLSAGLAISGSAPIVAAQPPDHPPYVAPSMNLAWSDCSNDGLGGTSNMSFACNTNTGDTFKLFASVRPPSGITDYTGNACTLDLQSATAGSFPLWWQFGGCRLASALAAAPSSAQTTCPDLSTLPHFGGIDYNFTNYPNRARLRTAYSIEGGASHPLDSLLEQTVLAITVNRSRTVNTGSCSGCTVPLCIVWSSILIDRQTGPDVTLITAGERYWATWQGASQSVPCPAATPVQSRTWGQVKSLYR